MAPRMAIDGLLNRLAEGLGGLAPCGPSPSYGPPSPKQCEDHTVLGRPTMGTIGGKATSCAAFLAGAANSTTHPSAADVCSYMAGVTIAEYRAITKGLYAPACCLPETDPLIEYCRGTCGKHGAGPCWATDTTPWC